MCPRPSCSKVSVSRVSEPVSAGRSHGGALGADSASPSSGLVRGSKPVSSSSSSSALSFAPSGTDRNGGSDGEGGGDRVRGQAGRGERGRCSSP